MSALRVLLWAAFFAGGAQGFAPSPSVLSRVHRSRSAVCISATEDDVGRRDAIKSTLAAAAATLALAGPRAEAVGPVNMELSDVEYEAVECPPSLKAGRIGGAFGGSASREVLQQCVKVTCSVTNPTKKSLIDAAVFGFVLDPITGASVIANNPDLRSDAGQFASIDEVAPGDQRVSFIFVATLGKESQGKLPPLDFRSIKAISYPGGARFAELSPCELDSLAPECEDEFDADEYKALREKKMRY